MTKTNEKMTVRFTINFFEKTIVGTKASFNKAGKGFGPEYEELTSKMAAHPDFTLEVKEQKSKTTKRKRNLRKTAMADVTNVAQVKRLIPYK